MGDVGSGINGDSKISGDNEALSSHGPTQNNESNSLDSKETSTKSASVLTHDAMFAATPSCNSAPRSQPLLTPYHDNDKSASRPERSNGTYMMQANIQEIAMTEITPSEIKSDNSGDRSLDLTNRNDSQKLLESTFEESSQIKLEDGTKFDIGLAAMADLYVKNKKRSSLFKFAETEFWISNRIAPLIGQNINMTLRKTKKFEANMLVEAQELALKRSLKIPKLLFRATWVFCPTWFLFMIFVIFAWGVNMDSDATELPSEELVEAAKSNCPTRKTYAANASLSVDVHGLDSLNLQGAQYKANEKNEKFERYGNSLGFEVPSIFLLPDDVSESYRFVASSVNSCVAGTIVLPIGSYFISATLLSVLFMMKNKKLKKNIAQEKMFHLAAASDLHEDDYLILLVCWPEALLKMLSEDGVKENAIKLSFVSGGKVEKLVDIIASHLF